MAIGAIWDEIWNPAIWNTAIWSQESADGPDGSLYGSLFLRDFSFRF